MQNRLYVEVIGGVSLLQGNSSNGGIFQQGHVMARAETLAMVSQHTLNTMEVDQFQDFGCFLAVFSTLAITAG